MKLIQRFVEGLAWRLLVCPGIDYMRTLFLYIEYRTNIPPWQKALSSNQSDPGQKTLVVTLFSERSFIMNQIQKTRDADLFQRGDCVLWHNCIGNRAVPVPGVVLEQRDAQVVIRIRLHDTLQAVTVNRHELIKR